MTALASADVKGWNAACWRAAVVPMESLALIALHWRANRASMVAIPPPAVQQAEREASRMENGNGTQPNPLLKGRTSCINTIKSVCHVVWTTQIVPLQVEHTPMSSPLTLEWPWTSSAHSVPQQCNDDAHLHNNSSCCGHCHPCQQRCNRMPPKETPTMESWWFLWWQCHNSQCLPHTPLHMTAMTMT